MWGGAGRLRVSTSACDPTLAVKDFGPIYVSGRGSRPPNVVCGTCGRFAPPHELRLRRVTTAVIPPHSVAYVEETLATSPSLSQERRCDSRWRESKFVSRACQQPMMQHTSHYAACFSHPP